ncbi:RNA recognition motif. family protein [Cryptosporidium muris RN66]|uniref:RNA recognition motif. family protein n=1 Tax=Cryptosporidium muris (strain RN66) TaxID=441375 RepID=B6AHD0_CRYMR|nr:RNA recognition motif. family protein [Cryptosporidium muris RN66]EEA07625.1 RNA recognition motif. family protein [Cryptosporidium muris RN66]|eukprot:XP_002141974.1 RNA recognition motif. family protein [Cryptosporidium muris RN66]
MTSSNTEGELCKSRTTRWADVEAEEDDLDMTIPSARCEVDKSSINTGELPVNIDKSRSDNNRRRYKTTQNKIEHNNKKNLLNLPKDPPFILRLANLDYNLQQSDIVDFFKSHNIETTTVKLSTKNGNNDGTAIVEFGNYEDLETTANQYDGFVIGSRSIRVTAAWTRNKLGERHNRGNNAGNNTLTQSGVLSASRSQRDNRNHTQSRRELSPDFTIVRKNVKSENAKNNTFPEEPKKDVNTPSVGFNTGVTTKDQGERPKLNLKPRSKPLENGNNIVEVYNEAKSRIFGSARPVQQNIEVKRKSEVQSGVQPTSEGRTGTSNYQKQVTNPQASNERRWSFNNQKDKGRYSKGYGDVYSRDSQHSKSKNQKGNDNQDVDRSMTLSNTNLTDNTPKEVSYNHQSNKSEVESRRTKYNSINNNRHINQGSKWSGSKNRNDSANKGHVETRNRFAALDES